MIQSKANIEAMDAHSLVRDQTRRLVRELHARRLIVTDPAKVVGFLRQRDALKALALYSKGADLHTEALPDALGDQLADVVISRLYQRELLPLSQ